MSTNFVRTSSRISKKMRDVMEVKILQLKESAREHMFRSYDPQVDLNNYKEVYSMSITDTDKPKFKILEEIYTKFNVAHPEDFEGHSLSVSDIVKLNSDYHYVDRRGFVQIL